MNVLLEQSDDHGREEEKEKEKERDQKNREIYKYNRDN